MSDVSTSHDPGPPAARSEFDLQTERWELLDHVTALTNTFMVALAFVWLGLLVLDFTRGLGPTLRLVSDAIWLLFGVDFAVKFLIAPHKFAFLKANWLVAVSLLLPAFRVLRVLRVFRVFRFLRAARAARSLGLLRLATSLNRGMRALNAALGHRGVGFVPSLTVLVAFAGAAGMYQFENPDSLRQEGFAEVARDGGGLRSYGAAVWWTAMILTTMGSEYWPKTVEGRVLCWALSLYAFAVFGYITATIATLFISLGPSQPAGADVGREVVALREELARLTRQVALLTDARDPSLDPDGFPR